MKKYIAGSRVALFLILAIAFSFCKKATPEKPLEKPTRGMTIEDRLKDSVYLYTYYFYLWQDQLPQTFSTDAYKTAEDVLEQLKSYAKDPSGKIYDRYSFLDRTGAVNAEIQEGRSGSFGFDVRYNNATDLYIKLVYPNSPAARAGLQRGWQILEINGNRELDTAALGANDFAYLWDALDNSPQISLVLKKPDNTTVDVHLDKTNFQIEPVLFSDVYTVGSKKVGYFVFDSFISTETEDGRGTYVKSGLEDVLSGFERQGVSEVIVDLRYNGGGAVITSEYLSNMLVPTAGNGQLMYAYEFNKTLQEDGWGEVFQPVKFNKTNGLQPTRIYFLITGGTASASELLINNLSPFVDIELIGEDHTYGKPVGFFPIDILKADLYAVSFKTTNNLGNGDYFNGMQVDKDAGDDVSKDWGDPEENMLRQALHYSLTGTFLASTRSLQAGLRPQPGISDMQEINRKLDRHGNKDMFDFRKKVKNIHGPSLF